MNWDQIENKWAAMTRRVRADLAVDRIGSLPKLSRVGVGSPEKTAIIADRKAGLDAPKQLKTVNE